MSVLRRVVFGATMATLSLAGIASATTVTSPVGVTYTLAPIKASSIGHTTLHGPLGVTGACNVAFEGNVETNGVKHSGLITTAAGGSVTGLGTSNCTIGYSATVLNLGSYRITRTGVGLAKVTLTGSEMTLATPLGFNCLYKTNSTEVGTLRDTSITGGNAEIEISAVLPRTGHTALCGASGTWTGSWTITTPASLYVH